MSIETYVFVRRCELLDPSAWSEAIKAHGFDLVFAPGFALPGEEDAFVPCEFEGLESGFDLAIDILDADEYGLSEQQQLELGDFDVSVIFSTYSNAQEIAGMLVAASVLCERTGGRMLADFFEEELLSGPGCIDFVRARLDGVRSQFNGPSKIRMSLANATDEVMPEEASAGYDDADGVASEIIVTLAQHGIDADQALPFAFYLYFSDEQAASAAQVALAGQAMDAQVSASDDGQWLCLASASIVPTLENLRSAGTTLLDVASSGGGVFDGWELGAGEADDAEVAGFAASILESMRTNFTASHNYALAEADEFVNLDLDYYEQMQAQFEALGYQHLADVEDLDVSANGSIYTFTRMMYHPEDHSLASMYWVPGMGAGILGVESYFANGLMVDTNTAPASTEVAQWPDILVHRLERSANPAEVVARHKQALRDAQMTSETPRAINQYDALIDAMNAMNRHKHEHLASIGWVTREFLVAQTQGDDALAERIYAAMQVLLSAESAS